MPCANDNGKFDRLAEQGMAFIHRRRRIKTEETAKVLAFVWGEEFIQFLAALAILPRTIMKNRMN